MSKKFGSGKVNEQSDIKGEEVVRISGNFKYGKPSGIDGITDEMLQHGEINCN